MVIRSGFIGCDAAALARRGVETTLGTPESAPRPMHLDEGTTPPPDLTLSAIGVEPAHRGRARG